MGERENMSRMPSKKGNRNLAEYTKDSPFQQCYVWKSAPNDLKKEHPGEYLYKYKSLFDKEDIFLCSKCLLEIAETEQFVNARPIRQYQSVVPRITVEKIPNSKDIDLKIWWREEEQEKMRCQAVPVA